MKKITLLLLFAFYSIFCFSQDPTVYVTNGGNGYSVIEGNTYTFTISMYSATTTDVVVDVATIANSADASDYTSLTTTVTIHAGQISSNSLTIPTNNDSNIETDENFTIEATVTSGNTANTDISRQITLWDNDTTPTVISYTTPTRVEGQTYNQAIYLSNYFSSDVTINITSADDTADASDYNATTTSLTIPAGERYAYFSISSIQDALIETDETYTITASVTSGNTTNNSLDIIVTIKDDDTVPEFNVSSYNATEGYISSVYVGLNRVYNAAVIVQLTTSNGTADNNDYVSLTQTKTIGAGYTGVNFQISTTDDTLDEPEESFNFTVTVTSGNTTNTLETGEISIVDNDGLPDFSIQASYYYDSPTGQGSDSLAAEEGYALKFTPRLTHPSAVDTDIEITTTNGTADNTDYTTSTITTTIPAGQYYNYNEVLSYPTTLDQLDEDDENLFVNAVVTSGNTYNPSYTIEGFILDNYHLNAQYDEITTILEVGETYQILDNDTFEGLPVIPGDLNITLLDTNSVGITLSSTGVLTIPSSVPMGYYSMNYEICESSNPTNCDSATIQVIVESPLEVNYTVTYVDFNGDGFVSVGDTVEYLYTVTNNGNAPITNIDGEVPYQDLDIVGGPLASLGVGQTDSTTFTATHIITQNDINFGYYVGDQEGGYFYGTYNGSEVQDYLYDQFQMFQLEQSDGIKVNAFVDTNGNGTQETSEINYPLGQFNYEINNDGVINNLYVSPHYLYESNPTTTYNLTYSVDSDYAAYNTTTASYNNITVPVGSGITTYNFPVTVTPYNDLSIDIMESWRPPIPGFQYWNYISYTNNSTETVTSGTIDFTIDNALNLLSVYESNYWYISNLASVTTTATGFSYTFNNLQPFETKRLWVKMQVPTLPTVSLGQLVTNSVDIELLTGEIVPLDNTSSLTQTIVGSYDPNDITEKHGEDIVHSTLSTDDYLTYTIRFENTGTANAINIRVEDLLDEQLDETTLKMVDASHAYSLERVGKQIEWNFFGVNLLPSQDDDSQIGHGFITFKVKPFPDYAVGDVIPNTAEIYFDFNPAIITNTWNTTFVESLGIVESDFSHLTVFPNPVKNVLQISNTSILTTIEITSILGKQILFKNVDALTSEIDLSEISNGVYFVKINSGYGEQIVKIIKE